MAASGWASCDLNIRNAILDALVEIDVTPQTDKRFINLTLGDPTSNPALQPPATATDAVIAAVRSGAYNGYGPTDGLPGTKAALAEFYSVPSAGLHYTPADVFMANGTSGAIDLIVTVLGRRGGNMLFPRPGFAYSPSPNARGVEDRYYNLIPEREWEVDLAHLDTLVDENTVAIFINNPSNPCGSNYSKEHLSAILDFAATRRVPVVSDEIYGEMVFAGEVYTPLANLNAERARAWTSSSPAKASPVPLITAGGLAKRWLVPGWRIGWLLLHDPADLFGFPFTKVLKDACAISLAPSSLPQAAVPAILRDTPASFYAAALAVVQENARLVEARLNRIAGLRVVKPRGSLYVLVGVDAAVFVGIKNEWDFVQKLVWEEAVFPLPGKCFRFEGYMRIVTSSKREDLEEACVRLELFCERHRKR